MDRPPWLPALGQRMTPAHARALVARFGCDLAALGWEVADELRARGYRLHADEPRLYTAAELVHVHNGRQRGMARVLAGHVGYHASALKPYAWVGLLVEWETGALVARW